MPPHVKAATVVGKEKKERRKKKKQKNKKDVHYVGTAEKNRNIKNIHAVEVKKAEKSLYTVRGKGEGLKLFGDERREWRLRDLFIRVRFYSLAVRVLYNKIGILIRIKLNKNIKSSPHIFYKYIIFFLKKMVWFFKSWLTVHKQSEIKVSYITFSNHTKYYTSILLCWRDSFNLS
jgi:hypothetical protein